MKNQPDQFEFDLDPQPKSTPVLQEPKPEVPPVSESEGHLCPQCEIGGGSCPRHPRANNPIIFSQDSPNKILRTGELDRINAEMMSRPPKKLPPATPEEIERFFEETKKEMEELDKRRAS